MDPQYRLFALIVMTFWIIAIALAIFAAVAPNWAHFA